ncbi:MAG: hypothetical protein VX111_09390, partial [Planctomycetota bacterium]|nr:hypothetical protein [Planctomycetota bacterium]
KPHATLLPFPQDKPFSQFVRSQELVTTEVHASSLRNSRQNTPDDDLTAKAAGSFLLNHSSTKLRPLP